MSLKPIIGVPACRKGIDGQPFHVVGEKYLQALIDGADANAPVRVAEELVESRQEAPVRQVRDAVEGRQAQLDLRMAGGAQQVLAPVEVGGGQGRRDRRCASLPAQGGEERAVPTLQA